jgi:catechol 2,3-dioxygenase-like lactoylglutathione lyase family enzyme
MMMSKEDNPDRENRRALKQKISMITLGVRDIAASLAFYRDGLGFPPHNYVEGQVDGGVAVGDLDMPPASSGGNTMNKLATPLRSYS